MKEKMKRIFQRALLVAAIVGTAATSSGCLVVPDDQGHHHWRWHHEHPVVVPVPVPPPPP